MSLILKFLGSEEGATALEYALIAAGISILCIAGAQSIGLSINNKWLGQIATNLN